MQYELRPITPDEFIPFGKSAALVFAETAKDEEIERERRIFEFERSIGVFDAGKVVGTAGAFTFRLTAPGPVQIPAAGVSFVTVQPTHRRQGILTAMMRRQLNDVRERGEPVAILYASESIIYGRFGYGLSSYTANYEIEPRRGALAHGHNPSGTVRLIDVTEARTVLPPVHAQFVQRQPGEIVRSDAWWDFWFKDFEDWRQGMSARVFAVYESASGKIEGYLSYRLKSKWENGFPDGKLVMGPLIVLNPAAREALWRFCLSVDLIGTVEARGAALHEPLRLMLADPRRLRVTEVTDGLWTRIADVPRALQARHYATADTLVLDVHDAFVPENTGRYTLDGSPEGATCRRSRSKPDISLNVQDLGAAYLGGTSFAMLAQAGRVREETRGALRRADAMFQSDPAPWCTTGF